MTESPLFNTIQAALTHFGVMGSVNLPSIASMNTSLASWHNRIVNSQGKTLCFVPQSQCSQGFEEQYESRIYLAGEIPTREHHWHDFLNACVWLQFPKLKAWMNAKQYEHARERHVLQQAGRNTAQNILAMFDECGIVIPYCDEALAQLVQQHHWRDLFIKRRRDLHQRIGFYIMGHGLLEKALSPYIGMTAKGILVPVTSDFFQMPLADQLLELDGMVVEQLSRPGALGTTKVLQALPVLGVPGWDLRNEVESFYDNQDYFRPLNPVA